MTIAPRRTFLLCFLAGACEGYDMLVAGVAASRFAPHFGLEPAQLGAVFAAATFGLFVGALSGGQFADRFGRKSVIVAALAVLGIFSIASAFATNVESLLLMRLLVGLGLGGALPNLLSLVAETGRADLASMRTTMLGSAMPVGGGVVALLVVAQPDIDWRTLFWIGGVAPLIVAAVMLFALPESKAFRENRVARAPTSARLALAGDGRLALSLLLWSSSFFTSLVLYMMVNWLPSLMEAKGFSRGDAAAISMLMTVGGGAAGFIFGGLILHWSDRRSLYALTWAGMLISVVGLGFAPQSMMLAGLAGLAIGFFLSAGQFLLYTAGAEIYPAAVRSTGVGFSVGIGRLGAVAGPLLAGLLLSIWPNPSTAILAVSPLLLLALSSAIALVRTTPSPLGAAADADL